MVATTVKGNSDNQSTEELNAMVVADAKSLQLRAGGDGPVKKITIRKGNADRVPDSVIEAPLVRKGRAHCFFDSSSSDDDVSGALSTLQEAEAAEAPTVKEAKSTTKTRAAAEKPEPSLTRADSSGCLGGRFVDAVVKLRARSRDIVNDMSTIQGLQQTGVTALNKIIKDIKARISDANLAKFPSTPIDHSPTEQDKDFMRSESIYTLLSDLMVLSDMLLEVRTLAIAATGKSSADELTKAIHGCTIVNPPRELHGILLIKLIQTAQDASDWELVVRRLGRNCCCSPTGVVSESDFLDAGVLPEEEAHAKQYKYINVAVSDLLPRDLGGNDLAERLVQLKQFVAFVCNNMDGFDFDHQLYIANFDTAVNSDGLAADEVTTAISFISDAKYHLVIPCLFGQTGKALLAWLAEETLKATVDSASGPQLIASIEQSIALTQQLTNPRSSGNAMLTEWRKWHESLLCIRSSSSISFLSSSDHKFVELDRCRGEAVTTISNVLHCEHIQDIIKKHPVLPTITTITDAAPLDTFYSMTAAEIGLDSLARPLHTDDTASDTTTDAEKYDFIKARLSDFSQVLEVARNRLGLIYLVRFPHTGLLDYSVLGWTVPVRAVLILAAQQLWFDRFRTVRFG